MSLDESDIGAVSENDICMGIFHDVTGEHNAESDVDTMTQIGGTRKLKGFATSFFKVTQVLGAKKNEFKYELREGTTYPPQAGMHFVAYGNFINTKRQQSVYETRTYQRYLKGINNWTYNIGNVSAQFGELGNLSIPEVSSTGHSIYLNDVYFTGTIKQLKQPIIKNGNWHTWLGVGHPEADDTGWYDTGIKAEGKDGLPGPSGEGLALVFRGDYKSGTEYLATKSRCDIVRYLGNYYRTKIIAGDEVDSVIDVLPTDTDFWYAWGANFESVATDLLLAENANIANFIFKGGKMVSQKGLLDGSVVKDFGDLVGSELDSGR